MVASDTEEKLTLDLTLTSSTVMLGEPLVVDYEVVNTADEEVWIELGKERETWATVRLVDEEGRPAPVRLDPRTAQGGISFPGARLAPGQYHHDFLVITRWRRASHIGAYTLHMEVRLPYILNSDLNALLEQTGGSFPKPWREMMPNFLVQERTLALTVTEPDPVRLRAVAEALRQTATTSHHFEQRIAAVRSLLSMPEAYALVDWEALTSNHLHTRDTLLNELALVMSPGAADILAQLLDPRFGSLLVIEQPAVMLDGMYRAGDAALKEHIKKIFNNVGKEMSEHPLFFPG